MGSTMTETMGSTMVNHRLATIIEVTVGRDLGAQAKEDTGEETTAPDKKEEGGEEDQEEDIAPMKERRGDTLVTDEETAQGP